jgi:hemerythrin-like metal-binding protein
MLLQESDSVNIFVPELDAEHRNLLRLGSELHQAIMRGGRAAQIQEGLRALLAHVEDHFSHEERLMLRSGCPTYDWHKRQHDGLRRKAKAAVRRTRRGDREALPELLRYLPSWLRDHISVTDRMMGAHLRNYERLRPHR